MPYTCKKVGWAILGMGILLLAIWSISDSEFDFCLNDIRSLLGMNPIGVKDEGIGNLSGFDANTQLVNTLTSVLILVGSLLVGFSRCRCEDEFTQYLRYRALTVVMMLLLAIHLLVEFFCWGVSYLLIRAFLVKLTPLVYVVYFQLSVLTNRRRNEE